MKTDGEVVNRARAPLRMSPINGEPGNPVTIRGILLNEESANAYFALDAL